MGGWVAGGHCAACCKQAASHQRRLVGPQALVDRPDEVRRVMNFKRLALTDLKVDIPRLAKKKVLSEALSTSGGLLGCRSCSSALLPHSSRRQSRQSQQSPARQISRLMQRSEKAACDAELRHGW